MKNGMKIQHNKRMTEYTVIADCCHTSDEMQDGDAAVLVINRQGVAILKPWDVDPNEVFWLTLPVSVQVSTSHTSEDCLIVYQGETGIYARPAHEFTPDRFTVLT
jgi:hypothetical protein